MTEELDDRFGEENRFGGDIEERAHVDYVPPGSLKIPQNIKARFEEAGYRLRWVRLYLNGQFDSQNIRNKMSPSEGFTFVKPEELEAEDLLLLGSDEKLDRFGDVVISGDLVLMKTRVENAEARRKYYRNLNKQQADAVNQRMRENQLQNDSRSVVRTGKNAHFSGH